MSEFDKYYEKIKDALPEGYSIDDLNKENRNILFGYIWAWDQMECGFVNVVDFESHSEKIIDQIETQAIEEANEEIEMYMISGAVQMIEAFLDQQYTEAL